METESLKGIVDELDEFGVLFELLNAVMKGKELHETHWIHVFVVVDGDADV